MTLKGHGQGQNVMVKVRASSSRSNFINSQNGQKSHPKRFGDVNMQILCMTTKLLKVTSKSGENGLQMYVMIVVRVESVAFLFYVNATT